MSRSKELIKNTGILMIAKISTQIVSFLLLPLYTALLSTAEYGRVDIYTSLVMIIVPFLTLQLEMGMFRYYIVETNDTDKKKVVTNAFAVVAIMCIGISIIFWIVDFFFHLKNAGLVYAFYLAQTACTVMYQVCRAKGDNVGYGLSNFISSALAILLNVLFIAGLGWKVEGILLSSVIAHTVSFLYMIFRTKIYSELGREYISKETAKTLLTYSIPLVFNQIASWTINYSDRLIILWKLGEGANGIFSVACKFANITGTFFNVFNVAWTENIVRSMSDRDGKTYIRDMFTLIFRIYMLLITGIINLLPIVFTIFVRGDFVEAYHHIPIQLVGMLFSGMSSAVGSIYIAYNRTKEVSITTILAGVCNVLVHLLLINSCGLYAASISTLVSFIALFIYRMIFIRKFFEISLDIKKTLIQLFVLMFAWIAYSSKNIVLILIGLAANLICVGIVIYNNKQHLMKLTKKD